MTDGVSLTAQAHPRPGLLKRIIFWLFHRRLSPGSLEEVEIQIPEEEEVVEHYRPLWERFDEQTQHAFRVVIRGAYLKGRLKGRK